jgi:hypothetical protein
MVRVPFAYSDTFRALQTFTDSPSLLLDRTLHSYGLRCVLMLLPLKSTFPWLSAGCSAKAFSNQRRKQPLPSFVNLLEQYINQGCSIYVLGGLDKSV